MTNTSGAMRQLIKDISDKAKVINEDFLIVPQNSPQLFDNRIGYYYFSIEDPPNSDYYDPVALSATVVDNDSPDTALSYHWMITSQNFGNGNFLDRFNKTTTFTATTSGIYQLRFATTDEFTTSSGSVNVTLKDNDKKKNDNEKKDKVVTPKQPSIEKDNNETTQKKDKNDNVERFVRVSGMDSTKLIVFGVIAVVFILTASIVYIVIKKKV